MAKTAAARNYRSVNLDRPAKPCAPGSIEHELDMCEGGRLRGDNVEHEHGRIPEEGASEEEINREMNEDDMLTNYHVDMSEPNREGDEISGDEHSWGLQGGESEIEEQENIPTGLPGDEEEKQDKETERRNKP